MASETQYARVVAQHLGVDAGERGTRPVIPRPVRAAAEAVRLGGEAVPIAMRPDVRTAR
jgi:hypothetical protein